LKLTSRAWAVLGLMALGCPLLVDDHLEIVPNHVAMAGDASGAAGEKAMPATMGGAPEGPACGVSSLPVSDVACPAVCDRCQAGRCIFECSTQAACEKRSLMCPPGLACQVECSAQQACVGAIVICPVGFDCDLQCGEQDACKETSLHCSTANCNVHCTAPSACEKTQVACTTAQCGAECLGSVGAPQLQCGKSCSCNPC
jgi:hypothetical protein